MAVRREGKGGEKKGREKGREGKGGDLLQGLRGGDRRPWLGLYFYFVYLRITLSSSRTDRRRLRKET